MKEQKILRLVLGDQLNIKHSWFKEVDSNVTFCLFEMRQETDYIVHHIQKVIGFFAAMREFSNLLKEKGHKVVYLKINDNDNTQSLTKNLKQLIEEKNFSKFEYLEPDEYRLDKMLNEFCSSIDIPSDMLSTEHFYTQRKDVERFFDGKITYLMESFYRSMRRKFDILIIDDQPEGGKWNYDKSNRNKWDGDVEIPPYKYFLNNVDDILEDIKKSDIKTLGEFNTKTFAYPISREQALDQLKYFCEELLIHFGDYQDAMHTEQEYLFHSRLSFALNLKLLSPKDVIKSVENYYHTKGKDIHISQVEGFVRQILGWREYMRGMYWLLMPKFEEMNFFEHYNPLPEFYWTGNTKMNCLKNAINNSLENGYAHHIQRLMVTGNFALLIGSNPQEVDDWYLGIYIDAIQWVQLPNTRGMSQFADGGEIATKPYISSGSYINKMSNYCKGCHYSHTKKVGEKACPFNSLYWNFLLKNEAKLADNPRMGLMYGVLNKMNNEVLEQLQHRAEDIIANPDRY